ncbi:hypothetical protein AXF42_Ash015412 [Apostasia shenzhenica]|uniref:Uncharacterized protein n=1 Tax=Apostasia shenzhenica TaxID=1088818 RepID=A0A2H9ZS51_9ASPA|nr:hypothetical protein AXF42_Ash015412 [Apostasia shenzhenica]
MKSYVLHLNAPRTKIVDRDLDDAELRAVFYSAADSSSTAGSRCISLSPVPSPFQSKLFRSASIFLSRWWNLGFRAMVKLCKRSVGLQPGRRRWRGLWNPRRLAVRHPARMPVLSSSSYASPGRSADLEISRQQRCSNSIKLRRWRVEPPTTIGHARVVGSIKKGVPKAKELGASDGCLKVGGALEVACEAQGGGRGFCDDNDNDTGKGTNWKVGKGSGKERIVSPTKEGASLVGGHIDTPFIATL